MTPQSLNERINRKESVEYLKEVFEAAFRENLEPARSAVSPALLSPFSCVFIEDSNVITLHEKLADDFGGSSGSAGKSALKTDITYEAKQDIIYNILIKNGTDSDQAEAKTILTGLQENDLILRDLGYFTLNMQWSEVLADKSLQDLSYKIELNTRGKIEMSPASNLNSFYRGEIIRILLEQMPKGKVMPEFAIDTPGGVKVPDVVWCSLNFLRIHSLKKSPFTDSPELCVEIVSESDTREEMQEKTQLYFDRGAKEVWLVFLMTGGVKIFSPEGEVGESLFGMKTNEVEKALEDSFI